MGQNLIIFVFGTDFLHDTKSMNYKKKSKFQTFCLLKVTAANHSPAPMREVVQIAYPTIFPGTELGKVFNT